MPQIGQLDLEGDGNLVPDGRRDQPQSTSNQPIQDQPFLSWESGYGDSSWPIYSMYSKIAEKEDTKMVERCQRDTDGTLIFTGLFSATVGALLTVSIPDLKPNSQDTSAFYLENIYKLFGSPNVSHPWIPSALTVIEAPAFSPPRYAIWVNSLWFLSLAISVSCAIAAMMHRYFAVLYIEHVQCPTSTVAKRARTRAVFSNGDPGPYSFYGTAPDHYYLHFSLLFFVVGCLIYLFNTNRAVFYAVVWWVGFLTIRYAYMTVAGFFDTSVPLYHTPLSPLVLSIYLGASYVVFQICSHIRSLHNFHNDARRHYLDLNKRYGKGLLTGIRRGVKEIALKPSSMVDAQILERILLTLDEDSALNIFFDAIPGFCDSKSTVLPLLPPVRMRLRQALDGFLDRTFSSSLISESVRIGRLITCLDAAHAALEPYEVSEILDNISDGHWDKALQSVEMGHALKLWRHSRDHDWMVRRVVARIVARVEERDERWILLVKETFGAPDPALRDYLAHGDSALLSVLIHVSRQANRAGFFPLEILSSLSKFDIRNTLPRLQRDFCKLWNEIAQEARSQGLFRTPGKILSEIHHLYIDLHPNTRATPTPSTSADSLDQGTNATPAPLSTAIDSLCLYILHQPWSYSLCNIASHRPDPTTHDPVSISDTVSIPAQPGDSPDASPHKSTLDYSNTLRLAEETNIITGLPSRLDPSTTSEIGETSHAFTATSLIHSNSYSPDQSPQDDVATVQPGTNAAYTLESNRQGQASDLAAPHLAPLADNSGTLPAVPTLAPLPASTPTAPNKLFTTYDASTASITKSSLPASAGGLSAPDSLSPPPVPPLLTAELLSQRSGMSPKHPSDNATPSHLHPCRLANNGDMYLANAMLQLLVCCPPFQDLIRDLGRLVDQRGGGESGGGATPLMDASVRFMDKFAHRKKSSVAHQCLQQVRGNKVREDEDGEKEDGVHSLQLTDVYDAMKEKVMRDGWQQDAAMFLGLYLKALDEELVTLRSSISTHNPDCSLEKFEEEAQLGEGQTEVREQGYTASSVKSESAISRIFGGRSRSTMRAPNQPDIITVEDWRSLKLNIQPNSVHTIQDALTHISQPQAVQVEVGQSSSSEARQQVQIEALPPILVLHLERFLYDATSDGIIKMSKPVQFAPELEIPLETMASVPGKSAELVKYELCGALYHPGESADSGHYVVEVLHPIGDRGGGEAWLHIDDEAVSMVQHEDVFWGHDNESENDRCASSYMLFYCRKASART